MNSKGENEKCQDKYSNLGITYLTEKPFIFAPHADGFVAEVAIKVGLNVGDLSGKNLVKVRFLFREVVSLKGGDVCDLAGDESISCQAACLCAHMRAYVCDWAVVVLDVDRCCCPLAFL